MVGGMFDLYGKTPLCLVPRFAGLERGDGFGAYIHAHITHLIDHLISQ